MYAADIQPIRAEVDIDLGDAETPDGASMLSYESL